MADGIEKCFWGNVAFLTWLATVCSTCMFILILASGKLGTFRREKWKFYFSIRSEDFYQWGRRLEEIKTVVNHVKLKECAFGRNASTLYRVVAVNIRSCWLLQVMLNDWFLTLPHTKYVPHYACETSQKFGFSKQLWPKQRYFLWSPTCTLWSCWAQILWLTRGILGVRL